MWQTTTEIELGLATQQIVVLAADPYAHLWCAPPAFTARHQAQRDQHWEIIASLVTRNTGDIFVPHLRGPLVTAVAQQADCSKRLVYEYLRRYWQAGQVKNALLPHYDRCGGKGQVRRAAAAKRGRPSRVTQTTGQPTGINITAEIRERFRRGIQRFYENRQNRPLTDAYQFTLETFFHQGYTQHEGVWVPILPPATELPTFNQFRYWYERDREPVRTLTARAGTVGFQTQHRELVGDSTAMAFGPGSVYQIDATLGDIYLVSALDPSRIIGRPVIYIVIDVFSRLITGFSVTLEGPSWLGAMLALENTTTDKVALCAAHQLTITPAAWPSCHLPEALLADRGELEGYNADNLVNGLNIQVWNTAPYRADWKGIVERNFRLLNDQVIRWLPGAVHTPRDRGTPDYRLDACLNLRQFRQLLLLCILHHNQYHRMDWYRLDEFMIQAHVPVYPLDLWHWGVQNRVGHLRQVSQDIVRLNLLPQDTATVTRNGLLFHGLHYTCDLAFQEQWFVQARERGSWRIPVAYDPRQLQQIYLRLDVQRPLVVADLDSRDQFFQRYEWPEVQDYQAGQKLAAATAQTRQQQASAELHAHIDQIVTAAVEQAGAAQHSQSQQARLGQIRQNRWAERELERQHAGWQLTPVVDPTAPEIPSAAPLSPTPEPDYIPAPQPIAQLRQLRQEKLHHE